MTVNPILVMAPPLDLKQIWRSSKSYVILYTSNNTKTLIDLKQIWRSSRIYEIFIFVG
jgi:hypothetical protein